MAQKRGKDAKIFFPFFMRGGSFRRTPTRRTGLTGPTRRRTNNKWPLSTPPYGGAGGGFLLVKNLLTFPLPRVAQICARLPPLACKKPLARRHNKAVGQPNKAAN